VQFKITEGKKVLIKEIVFEGNKAFSRRQLKKVMETGEKWFMSWLTGTGTYKEEVLKNDANLIADLYFNNGYINVRVGEPKVTLLDDRSGLVVTFGITEGDQYHTGSIDYRGDLLEPAAELAKKIGLKQGEVFSRAKLRGDVFSLTDLYADKGYAFANVNPLTKTNPEKKVIDITFDFEKGEKVYIDRISISGNTKSRDKVLRRELKLAEGDLYSSTGLKKSKQGLMNTGFFEEANLSTVKGSADNRLNLNVEVKEKSTGTFSVGAGYSSLDGLIGQGSVSQTNFLGLGLKANVSASIGGKSQTYNLGLTDPYFLDSRWTVGADVYRTERDYIDFSRRVTGGDIKAGYPLTDTINTFWVYKYEIKDIYNESSAFQSLVASKAVLTPEASSTTSSLFISLTRNTTDYRLDPSSGMMNTVSAEFAGLGGTNKFARYLAETTQFVPVKWGTVFSLRGTLGYIQKVSSKEVPIDERFYLGGISSLRGYGGRTVSPFTPVTNANNSGIKFDNISYTGGNKEAVFNAEFVFPLLKDAGLKGVAFIDTGNSYGDNQQMFSRFLTSYGLGIRWFSPIGPLRLEYGIPLNPRTGIDNSGGKLEFSVGSFF
jgi:outer membrane protein insertion porin family